MSTWTTKYSSRLFYRKYPYKVNIYTKGATAIRQGMKYLLSLPSMTKAISTGQVTPGIYSSWGAREMFSTNERIENRSKLIKIGIVVLNMPDVKLRIEGNYCSVFTESKETVYKLIEELDSFIAEITMPESSEAADFLLNNPKHIIVSSLPKGNMRFRVHVGTKNKLSREHGLNFLAWADKLGTDSVYIPPGLRNDLAGHTYAMSYVYGRYFYLKDERLVSLAQLFLPDHISRMDRYICQSEIPGK